MAYTPTVYVNDEPPAINADNLNKSEQGIETADANATAAKTEVEGVRIGVDGTVYQSAGVAVRTQVGNLDNSIEMKQDKQINYFNRNDSDILDHAYIGSDGNPVSVSGGFTTGYIPVHKTNIVRLQADGAFITSNSTIIGCYDSSKTFIKNKTVQYPYTVDEDCAFVRLYVARDSHKNILIVTINNDTLYNSFQPYGELYPQTKSAIDKLEIDSEKYNNELFINAFNKDDSDVILGKYLDRQGQPVNDNANFFTSGYIPVKYGDVFRMIIGGVFVTFGGNPMAYYDENKNFLVYSTLSGTSKTLNGNVKQAYIRISYLKANIDKIIATLNNPTLYAMYIPYGSVINTILGKTAEETLPWTGTTMATFGDSIMYNDGRTVQSEVRKGYPSYLRDIGFAVTNYGVSGACVAYHSETTYEDNVTTIDNVTISDFEMMLFEGGVNDYIRSTPLGTLDSTPYDKTTFYGAYQYIIDKILTEKPTMKIVLMTQLRTYINAYDVHGGGANAEGLLLKDYADAVKTIAEKYAIPVVDLYNLSGLNSYDIDNYTDDKLHPNNAGYKRANDIMIPMVKNMIAS